MLKKVTVDRKYQMCAAHSQGKSLLDMKSKAIVCPQCVQSKKLDQD